MILSCTSWFAGVVTFGVAQIDFCISCTRCTVCKTNAFVGEILNVIPDKAFLSKYLLLHQLLPTQHYIESIARYHGMTYCAPGQRCLRRVLSSFHVHNVYKSIPNQLNINKPFLMI